MQSSTRPKPNFGSAWLADRVCRTARGLGGKPAEWPCHVASRWCLVRRRSRVVECRRAEYHLLRGDSEPFPEALDVGLSWACGPWLQGSGARWPPQRAGAAHVLRWRRRPDLR